MITPGSERVKGAMSRYFELFLVVESCRYLEGNLQITVCQGRQTPKRQE